MSDMREMLVEQTSRLLAEHTSKELVDKAEAGDWPTGLWSAFEEAGLPQLLVSEDNGGVGGDLGDAVALIRQSARHATPVPIAETMLANWLWTSAGGGMLEGPATLGPAAAGDKLTLGEGGKKASGKIRNLPWGGRVKTALLLGEGGEGTSLVTLSPAAGEVSGDRNIAGEPRDTLTFKSAPLGPEQIKPLPNAFVADDVRHLGALMRAAQMVGAMEQALELTIGYANERKAFGRPIAKFQAVQHQLATSAAELASAVAAVEAAADAHGTESFGFWVAVAKSRAGEAAGLMAAVTQQVHGAIGYTQEYVLGQLTRRLWSWRDEFGSEHEWQLKIGREALKAGGQGLWPYITSRM